MEDIAVELVKASSPLLRCRWRNRFGAKEGVHIGTHADRLPAVALPSSLRFNQGADGTRRDISLPPLQPLNDGLKGGRAECSATKGPSG